MPDAMKNPPVMLLMNRPNSIPVSAQSMSMSIPAAFLDAGVPVPYLFGCIDLRFSDQKCPHWLNILLIPVGVASWPCFSDCSLKYLMRSSSSSSLMSVSCICLWMFFGFFCLSVESM